jgi:hypothetical protein
MTVRMLGMIPAVLLAIIALRILAVAQIGPKSAALPGLTFPFLAATLFGWIWALRQSAGGQAPKL